MKNIIDLREFAIDVVRSSNDIFKKFNNYSIINSEGKDLKAEIDIKLNQHITEKLSLTNIPIISEEGNNNILDIKRKCWIVDPLDGTFNFIRNFNFYSISIALWENKKPVFGVILDITNSNIYYTNNKNSFLNGKKILVSKTKNLEQSVLSTGFSTQIDLSISKLNNLIHSIQKFKKIRAIGSAAMSLCLVAEGVFDVYYENDIFFWDVAAGIDLVKKSGGSVYYRFKENSFLMEVLCTNKNLLKESKEILIND